METEGQRIDRERLERFIINNSLVSVMNNTKWEKLRALMLNEAEKQPSWKCRYLRGEFDENQSWEFDWYYHLSGFKAIEWLDINPRKAERRGQLFNDKIIDYSEYFCNLLKSNNIPFSIEGGNIRVWGYTWPGKSINFV